MTQIIRFARREWRRFLVVIAICFANNAFAATYYISPSGNNSGDGSTGSPWKTFAFAIPKLNPGDTLVAKDGPYARGSTGLLSINCSSGAKNASLSNPITVKAEHERRAFIKADGRGNAIEVRNCRGWVIQGFHAENSDNAGYTADAQPIAIISSSDIIVRRNLAAKPNRYGNNQGILVFAPRPTTSSNVLIEENELYDFHRNGIECFPETTSGCVIRRNFVANRNYGPLPGVKNFGPNDGIVIYFARNTIVENNVVEMNGNIPLGNSAGINTRFFGNIGLRGGVGAASNRHPHYGLNNSGTVWVDNVVIGAQNLGMVAISVDDIKYVNNTAIDAVSGFHANNKYDQRYFNECPPDCWSITPNVKMTNGLAVYKNGVGFGFANTESFGSIVLDHLNAFGNGTDYGPGTAGRTNSTSIDPKMGSCKVFIPANSPMKGAGAGGDDIGANVLCRYENGVLTKQQLWDWTTGQFPCGAIVNGVNNIAGSSCFDVNKRLNVNANGCTLPANPSCNQPSGTPPVNGGGGDTASFPCI